MGGGAEISASPNRAGPVAVAAAATGVALLLTLPGLLGYGIIDDAYICLRYADNLVAGHGLVFNPGERVEGYSNLLWTVILAGALWLGLDGVTAAVVLGLLFGAGAVLAAGRFQRRYLRFGSLPESTGAPIYLATPGCLPFVCYCASGLEVGLLACLLVVGMLCFVRGLDSGEGAVAGRALSAAGGALGLAALVRPELPALLLFHAGFLWLHDRAPGTRSWRTRLTRLLAFTTPPLLALCGQLWFRRSYYGAWLPNTYHAKVGGPGVELIATGAAYAAAFLAYSGLVLALALVLAHRGLRGHTVVRYLVGLLLTYTAAIVLEGGDHMALYRFFAPLSPVVVLLYWLGCAAGYERLAGGGRDAGAGAGANAGARVAVATVALGVLGSVALGCSVQRGMHEHERARLEVAIAQQWAAFGRWLAEHSRPSDSIALLPVGAIGFYSGRPVIDMVGLTDAHIAHLPVRTGARGFVGHEKYDNRYVLARAPRYVLAHHFVANSEPVSEAAYAETAYFPVHRELLSLPAFRRGYRYRQVRAGPQRYFSFYERRDAP